jgi:hypothetical protein
MPAAIEMIIARTAFGIKKFQAIAAKEHDPCKI